MASTSKQDLRKSLLPCVFFHISDDAVGSYVTLAHNIFVQLCPKGIKIVKEVFSKLPPKECKDCNETTKCRWAIIYCLDDDAQLSTEEVIREIRMAKPQNTRIVKEVSYHENMRLHIAVDYLGTKCRHATAKSSTISRWKVPRHYTNITNEESNHLWSLIDSTRFEAIEYIANNIQDPIKEMCLMLELNPWEKKQLDNWLVEAFQDCLPEHFDPLARYETAIRLSMSYPRHDEYPTLLHFAARFGLEKFVVQILERPESAIACHIKNKYDMTPAESAESDERLELAMMIKRYTSLNQFCSMYSKLKEISLKLLKMDEHSTISSKDFEDLHKICFPLDYFHKSTLSSVQPQGLRNAVHHDSGCANSDGSALTEPPPNSGQSQAPCEDKTSKEFLEILNDFSDKVRSNADLEKLVEDWNNRNNVRKSFKEKKEQLKEMAQRYEKIEMETGKSVKEAKIFDRASTFLEMLRTQDKKHEVYSADLCSKHSQKPVNTLKSSGTTRTIKEASRTRLDNEELKNTPLNHNEDNIETTALEENRIPVSARNPVTTEIFTNKREERPMATSDTLKKVSELLETVKEKQMAASDTLKKVSGTQLPPSNPPVPEAETSYEEYVIVDANKNEANGDKDEANDDMKEATDSMNEANDDMNKATNDINGTTGDKNEANDDNLVENASCAIS